MANFNTYQTRQFYVASDIASSDPANAGEIKMGQVDNGDIFFKYMNADGLLTRTDTIKPENITSLKLTEAADMDIKLKAHTIAVDSSAVTLSEMVGRTLTAVITVHEVVSYDASDTISFAVAVVGNSTNTASAAAFHKDLAIAIAKAMPKRKFPFFRVFSNGSEVTASTDDSDVTGANTGVVLVQAPQKYVRGKLSNEPFDISVAFHLHGSNIDDIAWGSDTVADSAISDYTVIPSAYALADLEYFALGERGDMYRGSTWPNNYEATYMIDLSKEYNVVTIEYYWQGGAENVQKSPRMIQIAAEAADSDDIATAIYGLVADAIEGVLGS